jgi:hypothetical protein
MSVKVKYSQNKKAIEARIRRLPKLMEGAAMGNIKGDMIGLIDEFQKGVKNNNFRLQPLNPKTIKKKVKKGYSQPGTPLYGLGLEDKNSYINMFRIRKIKNGYKIFARWAKHHESNLKLRDLFIVHEFGTYIEKEGKIIKIPPRPAWNKAFTRYMRNKAQNRKEQSKEVKKAIREYIKEGKKLTFDNIKKRQNDVVHDG